MIPVDVNFSDLTPLSPDDTGKPVPVIGIDLQLWLWGSRLSEKWNQKGNKHKQKHYRLPYLKELLLYFILCCCAHCLSNSSHPSLSWMILIRKGQGEGGG